MRSLIILEVEHGEDTDALVAMGEDLEDNAEFIYPGAKVTNWTVKVDLPPCFVLDSSHTD